MLQKKLILLITLLLPLSSFAHTALPQQDPVPGGVISVPIQSKDKPEAYFNKRRVLTVKDKENTRWDTARISVFNEILAFYGLCYWYTWQVSILGLGPIWMSKNEKIKEKAAQLLDEGSIFAFGLSEKEHGADIYSTEMKLIPEPDGTFLARGEKYYIGNGNEAGMVSTFGKITDKDGNIHSGSCYTAFFQNDRK